MYQCCDDSLHSFVIGVAILLQDGMGNGIMVIGNK